MVQIVTQSRASETRQGRRLHPLPPHEGHDGHHQAEVPRKKNTQTNKVIIIVKTNN